MASRTIKGLGAVAITGIVVVVGILGVLIAGAGVSWVLREPSILKGESIGVAVIEGTPTVVSCRSGGIGSAAVASGSSPSSPAVWRATMTGVAASVVPIVDSVQGYDVWSDTVVESGNTYSLTELTSATGVNNLGSIITFDPVDIPEGEVLTGDGKTMSISEFSDRTAGCVLGKWSASATPRPASSSPGTRSKRSRAPRTGMSTATR